MSDNIFEFCLFFKKTHSGCILPYSSHSPLSVKRAVVFGEIHRAVNRSSNNNNILLSLQMIFSRFLCNDYPMQFLFKCLSSYIYKHFINQTDSKRFDNYFFIKTPFFDENYYHRFNQILKKLNLHEKVKFYYTSTNLQNIFNPPKETITCNAECRICKLTDSTLCFRKYLVYCIECTICNLQYIGQTARILKHRITEHLTKSNSAIYQHHRDTHSSSDIFSIFKVSVIHSNIKDEKKRLVIESYYITSRSNQLMNGCVSCI